MDRAWTTVRDTDDIYVAVLQANGDRAFSTGVDVKEGLPVPDNQWTWEDPGAFLGPRQNRMYKPVIAAVHGMAQQTDQLLKQADLYAPG